MTSTTRRRLARRAARPRRTWVVVLVGLLGLVAAGCGAAEPQAPAGGIPSRLAAEARPIGRSARFHPPAGGTIIGRCAPRLGARAGVHVEVFAANRVVLLPAGISARRPLTYSSGRIVKARCYGALVTVDPTGTVLVRPGRRLSLGDLFRAWGQRLSRRRLVSFTASPGARVAVYVNGRRWAGLPGRVPLKRHNEIVLEVGPHVPPHKSYTFPPGI
ncbi:MAG: hypothetical protein WBQ18_08705 [Solirubrobacteraceae bacterium]